jgi:hypothetical protein
MNFYNLINEKEKFIIKNIHVLKIDNNNTKINEETVDLTIKILLNGNLNINFKDGTKMNLNKGDFITHNSFSIESMVFNFREFYMLVADIVS